MHPSTMRPTILQRRLLPSAVPMPLGEVEWKNMWGTIIIRIPIKGGMTIQLTEGMCVWGNGAWQELPVENCRCKSSSLNRPCLQWQRLTDGSIVNDCKCSIPLTVTGGIHHLLFDPTCRKRGSLQGRKMSAELMT